VVLWFEHDLYDQLQLLDVLALAATVGGTPELIVVGSFPGRPAFRGLGELTADELETLWPQRVPASPDVVATAAAAWDAVRRSDPSALAVSAQADKARAAVPRPGLAAAARGAASPARRLVRDGTAGAASRRGGRDDARGGFPCGAGARDSAVPRRCLVLPHAHGPWDRRSPPGRNAGRRTTSGGSAARRRARFRRVAAHADPPSTGPWPTSPTPGTWPWSSSS
jgi:hypothetical protein